MSRLTVAVEEFTTPNPLTARDTASLEELQRIMQDNNVRHIPIVKNNTVVGIVSDRDLKLISGLSKTEKLQVKASDIMSPNPVTVSAGATLDEVAYEMSRSKIGSVIVNDENDEFLGIFTVTDALNALIEIARG